MQAQMKLHEEENGQLREAAGHQERVIQDLEELMRHKAYALRKKRQTTMKLGQYEVENIQLLKKIANLERTMEEREGRQKEKQEDAFNHMLKQQESKLRQVETALRAEQAKNRAMAKWEKEVELQRNKLCWLEKELQAKRADCKVANDKLKLQQMRVLETKVVNRGPRTPPQEIDPQQRQLQLQITKAAWTATRYPMAD